jgi:hypothetical protein
MDGSFYCIFNGILNNPFEIKTIESELTEDNNQLILSKKIRSIN